MSTSRESTSSAWTYRMEVPASGAPASPPAPEPGTTADPTRLVQLLVSGQAQMLEQLRLIAELQRQQLDLARESVQIAREQRARQIADLERWQSRHGDVLDESGPTLAQLEQVHAALMTELVEHVREHHDELTDGEYALTDFVDKFGPRLAHLNTMLAILRPLAAAQRPRPNGGAPS